MAVNNNGWKHSEWFEAKAWQTLCTINCTAPSDIWYARNVCRLLTVGIESNQRNSETFRVWSRRVFHNVIENVMAPIEELMSTGIKLACGDGRRRLCFPVLCQYIGDMEEQWNLTCLIKPSCPKCPKRTIKSLDAGQQQGVNWEANRSQPDRRTDADVKEYQEAFWHQQRNATSLHT